MGRDLSGSPGARSSIIGGAFRDTAWLLRQDGPRILLASILLLAPIEAAAFWLQAHAPGGPRSLSGIAFTILAPLVFQSVLVSPFIAGLCWSVSQRLQGQRATLGSLTRHAVRRWPVLIGVELVGSLALFGGLVLLIVPGLVLTTRWLVVAQVAAIEGGGVRNALARSAQMTKGRRWAAFGVLVIQMMGSYGSFYALQLLLGALIGAPFRAPLAIGLNRYLFTPLYWSLAMSVSIVFYTAVFHRLAASRGFQGESAAQVFD